MQTHESIELAFIAVAALALVCQTILLIALVMGANKAMKSVKEEIADLRSNVMPVIERTRDTIDRLTPKVERTVDDISEVVKSVRRQTADIEEVVGEVIVRVRTETGRIDHMFSGTLDAVDKASQFVTQAVSKPVRQISGILASAKAIIESLRASQPPYRDSVYQDDKDMFV